MIRRCQPQLDGVSAVLLDIGGVLMPDPWETIVLTPGVGLADRLGLDRQRCEDTGPALWPRFSRSIETEDAWWDAFEAEVGTTLPRPLIETLTNTLLVPLPAGQRLLAEIRESGIPIGVITDNTAFWYPRQVARLRLEEWADPALRFTSHETGVGKGMGLFDLAATRLDPASVLVIDDRDHNLKRAAAAGFRTFLFDGAGHDEIPLEP